MGGRKFVVLSYLLRLNHKTFSKEQGGEKKMKNPAG